MLNPSGNGPALLASAIDAFIAYLNENSDFRTIAYGGRFISRPTREAQTRPDAAG